MNTAQIGTVGYPPKMEEGAGNPEALKYGKMWDRSEYRQNSPGEQFAHLFLSHARPKPDDTCIDFGCGTGRGALMLAILGQMKVTMVDFVRNCLDDEIRQACDTQADRLSFLKHDIEQPLPTGVSAEYGYCCDVLEHIPEMHIGRVLDNILQASQHCFFSIATVPDKLGGLIGEELHVTIHDYHWWCWQFAQHDCVIHWSAKNDQYCFFYVTAWKSGQEVVKSGKVNTEQEAINKNIEHNIAQGWEQVRPHPIHDVELMILGGGPSLGKFEDEIKRMRAEGVKLITLNGSYNWAIAHGLIPSAQIVVDARQFNARFTKPVIDGCKYLIASQCHPDVFEGLPKDRTYIWHVAPKETQEILNKQYNNGWYAIPGGSSVLLRAIPLLRMLGFKRFHLYGCDSCLIPSGQMEPKEHWAHHAYSQPENDAGMVVPVTLKPSDRVFYCHGWMVAQAQEFMDTIRWMGDEIELAVYGDGLLAHIMNVGADGVLEQ